MSTLPSDSTPKTDQTEDAGQSKKVNKDLKSAIDQCKQYRRKLVANWIVSIDYRRGKPFSSQTDEDRIAVNLDWSLTKAKHAALFSQVPAVRISHPPQTTGPNTGWVSAFETKLNDTMIQAGIETAMEEIMPDCINASGIGVALIAREAITTDVEVPAVDLGMLPPQIQAQIMQTGAMPDGTPVPMTTVPKTVDQRYLVSRISPADFLWPINFTGSDFDNAPWLGRSGRIPWAEAKKKWNLSDGDKQSVLGEDRSIVDRLTHDVDKDKTVSDNMVSFDEIFYKEYQWDPAAQSFSTIHHLVYVHGKEEPVVDTEWEGQQDQHGTLVGALRYPVQVLTLSYLTDEAIPPSDSAIGRPQVNEINKSRTQMILQRERSLPIRWFDVNRIDPLIQQSLMRGTWQGMIPVQGQGTNVIGEVDRANHPQENFAFDKIAKADLTELWVIGEASSGANVETKGEASFLQANRQTNVAKERARVGRFYCRAAEILGGLLCVFEDPSIFGQGFDPAVSRALSYSILADSTMLLDSEQRLQRALNFYNFAMKTGWVAEEPVLKEIATLSGFNASEVIRPPQPKQPQEPNISLRLTGAEDMMNPLMYAFLVKSGQAPSMEQIEQAKQAILAAQIIPPNAMPAPPPMPPQMGPDGQPMPEAPPQTGPQMIPAGPPMPVPSPQGPLPGIGEAHPDLSAMPRVNQRVLDRGE